MSAIGQDAIANAEVQQGGQLQGMDGAGDPAQGAAQADHGQGVGLAAVGIRTIKVLGQCATTLGLVAVPG